MDLEEEDNLEQGDSISQLDGGADPVSCDLCDALELFFSHIWALAATETILGQLSLALATGPSSSHHTQRTF